MTRDLLCTCLHWQLAGSVAEQQQENFEAASSSGVLPGGTLAPHLQVGGGRSYSTD